MFERIKRLFLLKDGYYRKKIGNNIMYLDPKDPGLSEAMLNLKPGIDREAAFMKVLREEVKPGMTAVDLGANIGYVTLILAELIGPEGTIYAIEPEERNYKLLTKNVEANNYQEYVSTYHLGISNHSGPAKFYISEASNLHSMTPNRNTSGSVDVTLETFDNFIRDKKMPNFIKMDIEGHEVEVLEGMLESMKDAPSPIKILMEVHPMYYSEEHSMEKSLRQMIDIGFHIKYVITAAIGEPDFFKERGYKPREIIKTGNWYRGIYENVKNEDAISATCFEHDQYIEHADLHTKKIVRAIMLEK